jgi:hypothetical protein
MANDIIYTLTVEQFTDTRGRDHGGTVTLEFVDVQNQDVKGGYGKAAVEFDQHDDAREFVAWYLAGRDLTHTKADQWNEMIRAGVAVPA